MLYQQINLADHSLVGAPGPLPQNLVGLPNAAVADMSAVCDPPPPGMAGQGWWPIVTATPVYDGATQIPDGTSTYAADVATRTVVGTANIRALTTAEFASGLAAAQTAQIAILTAACGAEIVGGFPSAALGAPHLYPSNIPVDQINLMGSVTDSLLPGLPADWTTAFWVRDPANPDEGTAWAYAPHTAAQIQMAGRDGKTHVAAAQAKLDTLKRQVMAATTVAAAHSIQW